MRSLFISLFLLVSSISFGQDVSLQGETSGRENIPYFIILGDPQIDNPPRQDVEDNFNAVRAIFRQIAKENPAFVFLLGDLVFSGDGENYWKKFDHLISPVKQKQIPTYSIVGNHEYFGIPGNLFEYFFSRFPYLEGNTFFELGFGNVRILALNSNYSGLATTEEHDQVLWYRDRLDAHEKDSSVTSVIVAVHHPPYSNSDAAGDDANVQLDFVNPFVIAKKTKLFVCGHSHAYEHFIIEGKHFINSGGAGPRQKIKPSVPTKQDLYQGGETRPHHYLKVYPLPDGLSIEMIKLGDDGLFFIGDTVTIK